MLNAFAVALENNEHTTWQYLAPVNQRPLKYGLCPVHTSRLCARLRLGCRTAVCVAQQSARVDRRDEARSLLCRRHSVLHLAGAAWRCAAVGAGKTGKAGRAGLTGRTCSAVHNHVQSVDSCREQSHCGVRRYSTLALAAIIVAAQKQTPVARGKREGKLASPSSTQNNRRLGTRSTLLTSSGWCSGAVGLAH